MLKHYKIRYYDFKLAILTIALAVIGIVAVGSAEPTLQARQIAGFAFGVFLMLVISLFDYSVLLNLYWIMYIFNVVLLVLVIVMGKDAGGAQRWLRIAGIQFQPSELAKILLVLFFAQFINKHREKLNTFQYISLCCLLFALPAFLVYKQPDLSTTIVICLIFCVIMFTGGISWKVIGGVLAVGIPAFVIFMYLIMQPDQKIISEEHIYQLNRIISFFNKEEFANSLGYQQEYSVMAIGSGQLTGKGYKNNEISSVKNADFIAEQQTDFIFAVIGEEFGFVGACTVIVLVLLISMECMMIAWRARDTAGTIIAAGIGAMIGFQAFINIGVVTYLLPNTGLPLPFVSYGLTSLVSSFIGIGFVLNVGLQCQQK
ncbi:FtsW/RodA/SpoVE family cell cycle protein [Parablautia muri]|uniref:Rod shape-determining protein RodA n=1 Tax=Parablautia muri TaxID=2320879 RepID=A0A9X5BCW6_9FIRM|nr:FtsW/RodA/SpoVE family cell cycle protein [Parablautia muri]NBJ91428.1 rod shape-determining protein RodA [Parablautia muri]